MVLPFAKYLFILLLSLVFFAFVLFMLVAAVVFHVLSFVLIFLSYFFSVLFLRLRCLMVSVSVARACELTLNRWKCMKWALSVAGIDSLRPLGTWIRERYLYSDLFRIYFVKQSCARALFPGLRCTHPIILAI